MEKICKECKKPAKNSCACNELLRFSSQCFSSVQKTNNNSHEPIDLNVIKINQTLKSTIEYLDIVKSKIMIKSNELIKKIHSITTEKLLVIEKCVETCILASKNREIDAENFCKSYQNIEAKEADLEAFEQILSKDFFMLKGVDKTTNPEFEPVLNEPKLKSLKFSKNFEEIKQEQQSNFDLFLKNNASNVLSAAVTNDRKYVIYGLKDKSIVLWNLLEKRQEAVLHGHTSSVYSVAATPNKKYIISGSSDNTIRIWNLLEIRQEVVLEGHESWIASVAVTSDNKYIVSGSGDKTVRLWNLLKNSQEFVFKGHTSTVWSVAVTTDNKYIVSSSTDKTIRIWNISDKNIEFALNEHFGRITSAVMTSDKKFFIFSFGDLFGSSNTVRVWSLLEKKQKAVLNVDDLVTLLEINNSELMIQFQIGQKISENLIEFI